MLFRPQGALLLSNLGVELPEDDVTPKATHIQGGAEPTDTFQI